LAAARMASLRASVFVFTLKNLFETNEYSFA
jgi:hypothetical protein